MARAMRSQAEVSAASHVPTPDGEASLTAIRIEGFGPSVEARARMLAALLARRRTGRETMEAEQADAYWRKVRRAALLGDARARPVLWRICVPPSQGAAILSGHRGAGRRRAAGLGRRTGLGAHAGSGAAGAAAQARGRGGRPCHAGRCARRGTSGCTPALHPEPPAVAALSRRVREAFDPAGVFDPLRFAARDEDRVHARAAGRSGDGGIREGDPNVRALRLLHGDVPDLCAAGRRARQPARAHLADQGHAGA